MVMMCYSSKCRLSPSAPLLRTLCQSSFQVFLFTCLSSLPCHCYHMAHTGTPLFKNPHDQKCKLQRHRNTILPIKLARSFFFYVNIQCCQVSREMVPSYMAGKDKNSSIFLENHKAILSYVLKICIAFDLEVKHQGSTLISQSNSHSHFVKQLLSFSSFTIEKTETQKG